MRWRGKKRDEGGNDAAALSAEHESKRRSQSLPAVAGERPPLSAHEVVAMQRLVGNQAVLQMLQSESNWMGEGQSLDAGVRAAAEPQLQKEFGGVHVHTGSEAAGAAKALGVQAFTWGKDIFFGEGKYQPHSAPG